MIAPPFRHSLPCAGHPHLLYRTHRSSSVAGWVYIMTNRRNGTLYIGVTSDLVRRVWEHREGVGSSFVRRYGLTRLVYFEHHEDIRTAIQRETSLKRWPRTWKVLLLAAGNPDWEDLYTSLLS